MDQKAIEEYLRSRGMRILNDLTGKVFGRLTVVERVFKQQKRTHWRCLCSCGKEHVVWAGNLSSGRTLSCGCLQGERTATANVSRAKHGRTRHKKNAPVGTTPTYRSWKSMLDRCRCSKMPSYHLYGGRGVVVCPQWQGGNGFVQFLADMGERPTGKTLDRIDTDGNYEPGNCRWATPKEQAANRRKRRSLTR